MRAMCAEQHLLLKTIKIEKIEGKANMAIRNLRRNVATQGSVREQQDQLRDVRQATNSSVQPKQAISKTVYFEGKPTPVCFINGVGEVVALSSMPHLKEEPHIGITTAKMVIGLC
ncbi:uncharacterized protein LOC116433940 isoform X5 [Nomia melanderi]|uniref:uncharacterized protein LOC116433940 isoform X5 n=1 Tax=Nomia melanderi TaxID=2448451 RepID=UPI003FCD70A9